MGCEILVDGYNVIKNNEPYRSAQKHGLSYARTLLMQQLHSKYRHTPYHVTVVFDGDGVHEIVTHEHRLQIIFSRYGETADQVIVRRAAELRKQGQAVETVSDDLEVRHGVGQSGDVRGTRQLTYHLNAPARDVEQKIRHRQQASRAYGLNPANKPADDDFYSAYPKGKKSPRRRK